MYSPRNNTTTSLIQWKLFPYGSREIDVRVASWRNGLQLMCVESDGLVNTGSSLYPSSLSPVQDERNQVLTTYLWIRQVWHDAYLRWDKEDYDDLEMINIPSDLVWKPDIVLYNKSVTNAGTERLKRQS